MMSAYAACRVGLELPICEMRKCPGSIMRGGREKDSKLVKGGTGERANLRPTYHTDLPY